jgi:hypothetical protein
MTKSNPFGYSHNGQRYEALINDLASLPDDHIRSLLKQTARALDVYQQEHVTSPSSRTANLLNWATEWCDAVTALAESRSPVESAHQRAVDLLNILDACSLKLDDIEQRISSAHSRIHHLSTILDELPIHRLSNAIL